ncbi:MAG: GDP-mannose 4,6-dehydratase, partial [Verrucomicrobiota bacterium]
PPPVLADSAWKEWMANTKPEEIYYLPAYHRASEGKADLPLATEYEKSHQVHVAGLNVILQSMVDHAPESRLFYASTCLIFGSQCMAAQNEETPYQPEEIYSLTKATGTQLCEIYRNLHGLHVSVGILFNHESALRAPHFFSQKVIRHAWRLSQGEPLPPLTLGSLEHEVDWSHAAEFTRAFHLMLTQAPPSTVVFASGRGYRLEAFVRSVFNHYKLDWREHITQKNDILTRKPGLRVGNPARLSQLTGWASPDDLDSLVQRLISETEKRLALL